MQENNNNNAPVKENMLGTRPIPQLMLQFGIPSVVSMFVNSIYNLVDQIFIGQRVGYLGNAATNVTFPFVTISMAISLMIAVGTAANVGLNLGRRDQDRADRTMGCGFVMAAAASLLLLAVGQIFLSPMLRLFGATDLVMPYAIPYARIYILGLPFTTLGILLSDMIRADGSPAYTMRSMLAGAVFNIVFDYIFVFPLDMGVRGAALATILGQLLTLVINLAYIPRFRTLHFGSDYLKFDRSIATSIVTVGFSSFITQSAMLVTQVLLNNQAVKYGAMSEFGAEIPLTVFGIVMKINGLMVSVIMGMVIGSQPVYSYNYGARKFDRVRELIRDSMIAGTVIGLIGMAIFQLFPQQLISIFGQEDELYNTFAVMAIRTMTILIFILGIQMTAGTYFQAVGKPKHSILISLSRSLLFMVPFLIILPIFFGVRGIMYCYPASDLFAVILCTTMLLREIKNLRKEEEAAAARQKPLDPVYASDEEAAAKQKPLDPPDDSEE